MIVTASTISRLCISVFCLEPRSLVVGQKERTGTRTVEITNNVGHTSLVTHHGGQMNGLLGVILCGRCTVRPYFDEEASISLPWGRT